MSIHQETDYNSNIDTVSGLQFSVLSPDEIRRRSVAEINTQETYDGDNPKIGGLFDPRMGVLDHGKKCPTDLLDNRQCPGYFGHINLAQPVFHIQFIKYTKLILKCVCWKCSSILLPNPEIKLELLKIRNFERFSKAYSICSKRKVLS